MAARVRSLELRTQPPPYSVISHHLLFSKLFLFLDDIFPDEAVKQDGLFFGPIRILFGFVNEAFSKLFP